MCDLFQEHLRRGVSTQAALMQDSAIAQNRPVGQALLLGRYQRLSPVLNQLMVHGSACSACGRPR
jgi:hypothetical protein